MQWYQLTPFVSQFLYFALILCRYPTLYFNLYNYLILFAIISEICSVFLSCLTFSQVQYNKSPPPPFLPQLRRKKAYWNLELLRQYLGRPIHPSEQTNPSSPTRNTMNCPFPLRMTDMICTGIEPTIQLFMTWIKHT